MPYSRAKINSIESFLLQERLLCVGRTREPYFGRRRCSPVSQQTGSGAGGVQAAVLTRDGRPVPHATNDRAHGRQRQLGTG